MSAVTWFDDAKRIPAAEVAEALGMNVRRKGGITGFTCPLHNEDHSDGRPSGRLVHGGNGWRCWACDDGGDGIGLAAVVLTGDKKPSGEAWATVRAWYASRGWCSADGDEERPYVPRPKPASQPVKVREVKRLPRAEVEQMWDAGWSVYTEPRARRWLSARGLVDWHIASLGLVRSLPEKAMVPGWAVCNREAWSNGHSLMIPAYDDTGAMVGLRARWTGAKWDEERATWVETSAPGKRKEVNPRGSGVLRGTVYACPVGRWLLEHGPAARRGGTPDPSAPDLRWDGRVLVVEGGPAWLRYAADPMRVKVEDGSGWTSAVFGVWSGAWPDDDDGNRLAARMANAACAVMATDIGDAGEKYAERIAKTLKRAGVRVVRAKMEKT